MLFAPNGGETPQGNGRRRCRGAVLGQPAARAPAPATRFPAGKLQKGRSRRKAGPPFFCYHLLYTFSAKPSKFSIFSTLPSSSVAVPLK